MEQNLYDVELHESSDNVIDPEVNENASASVFELERVPTNSLTDLTEAWVQAYTNLMEKSVDQFHTLLGQKMTLVESKDYVNLYERNDGKSYGYYTWKVTAVLNVYADRLMHVIKDFNPKTRLKWDMESVASIDELESFDTRYGPIRVYKLEEKYNLPFFTNRVFLGIGWKHFNKKTNTYKFVFRTTEHRLYKCPEGKTKVVCLFGVIIRVLEMPNKCECNIVQYMNPGDKTPGPVVEILKSRFLEKLFLYERVTKEWKKYYE